MCIYIYSLNKKSKKNLLEGCATLPNVPKFGVSDLWDTAKTFKN